MEWSFTEICFVPSLVEIATGSSAHFIFALALSPKSMVGELTFCSTTFYKQDSKTKQHENAISALADRRMLFLNLKSPELP